MDYIGRKRNYQEKRKKAFRTAVVTGICAAAILLLFGALFFARQARINHLRKPNEKVLIEDIPENLKKATVDKAAIEFEPVKTEILKDDRTDSTANIEIRETFEGGDYKKEETLDYTYVNNGDKWELKNVSRKQDPKYSFKEDGKETEIAKEKLENEYSARDIKHKDYSVDGDSVKLSYSGDDNTYFKLRGEAIVTPEFQISKDSDGTDNVSLAFPVTEEKLLSSWDIEGEFRGIYQGKQEVFISFSDFTVQHSENGVPAYGTVVVTTDCPMYKHSKSTDGPETYSAEWEVAERADKDGNPALLIRARGTITVFVDSTNTAVKDLHKVS